MGLSIAGGAGRGVFANLYEEQVGTIYQITEAALHIGLSPTYNMSLELVPMVRYQQSTDTILTDMNGFPMGIGGTLSFRFGKDPDSSENSIKSIRFQDSSIDPLFAAMQSYYRENPFGSVTLENTEKGDLTDLTVSFYQAGYMDAPTISARYDHMEKGEVLDVSLTAVFNKEIFRTEGSTPPYRGNTSLLFLL